MHWQPGRLTRWLYPAQVVWRGNESQRKLFLTFDDGPEPTVTDKVLDILEQHKVKATFFCLGKKVQQHSHLFKQIITLGHAIGNHGFSHLDGWKTPNKTYFENIAKAHQFIRSSLFRPPYGHLKYKQMQYLKKKYRIILWDVMSYDFKVTSADTCFQIIKKHANNGSIIVFHDTSRTEKNMIPALQQTIDYFKGMGFHFDILPT